MLRLQDFKFNKTEVSPEKTKEYKSEDDFMRLAVDLFKEIGIITTVISCTYRFDKNNRPRKWTRNEAILGGLLVRISKLQSSLLDQICQKRMETGMILFRCLGESLINLKYLLTLNNQTIFDEFIEYSLREEKRLLKKIEENINERGYTLPIEKRMQKSIMRAFNTSNFRPDDVDETMWKPWGEKIYERARSMDMEEIYFAVFSLPSHDVHGNWQNLISNHLEYENGEFSPNTERKMPRPQPLFLACILSAEINKLYVEKTTPECTDKKRIINMLDDLNLRVRVADELHEQFLQKE